MWERRQNPHPRSGDRKSIDLRLIRGKIEAEARSEGLVICRRILIALAANSADRDDTRRPHRPSLFFTLSPCRQLIIILLRG